MDLLSLFRQAISSGHLFSEKDKLLLAVSGGVDSAVLCELCHQAGFDFMIAHCNFRLRGEEGDRDEAFVTSLGVRYGVQVVVKPFDTQAYAAEKKVSIQLAARELRYTWFNELIAAGQARYILTAHHADDNAETALMNFCRGTGLQGLAGIPAIAGNTRRPLLTFSKEQLLEYARATELSFVEDSSNASSKYTRNLFRNEVIPLIAQAYPQVQSNLLDNIGRFTAIAALYDYAVEGIKKRLCRPKGNEVHIPIRQLLSFDNRALIYAIISGFGFTEKQVEEVLKLAGSESGRYLSAPDGSHRIIRHGHWFIISPVQSEVASTIIVEETDRQLVFPGGVLLLEAVKAPAQLGTDPQTAWLDADEVEFPLLLRRWKQGDYFYPLGMKKKKKLSRFFIDQKLSKTQKEQVWVLEMNKKILWVAGCRIDERFKVTEQTRRILKISIART